MPAKKKLKGSALERQNAAVLASIQEHGNLRQACRDNKIPVTTFITRVEKSERLAEQYAKAKEQGIERFADEIAEIADDESQDIFNPSKVARDRLRIDSRKWLLSKLIPKKYGDKLDVTTGGEKIPAPIIQMLPPNE